MKAVLVISERDNVATALEPLEPGRRVEVAGEAITVAEPIAPGHKVALRAIPAGEAVVKYGSPIGLASANIPAGAHVHTHNLSSTRGRGDLAEPTPAGPRHSPASTEKRLRPERGAGGKPAEGRPPSESERGWGPASIKK